MKPKDRHISILEYFNRLQLEYLLYELRTKIYPSSDDKAKFKKVLQFKKDKINDISKKNMLISIFDDEELKRDMTDQLFGSENMPEGSRKNRRRGRKGRRSNGGHNIEVEKRVVAKCRR